MKLVKKELLEQSPVRYDLEIKDNHNFIANGVVVHNCNARYVFHNGEFHCGSRYEWKKEFATPPNVEQIEKELRSKLEGKLTAEEIKSKVVDLKEKLSNRVQPQNIWWKGLRNTPALMDWLKAHPDVIVYGELYGGVKGFPYDTQPGEVKIAVFDIMNDGKWVDPHAARISAPELPWVPTVADDFSFDFDKLLVMADGNSALNNNHIKEGVVVSPVHERTNPEIGRVKLKIVSEAYLRK